jgi:hypothetical protein
MATIGRPPVLDEGKRREVCALVYAGLSRRAAAERVGCHVNTIRNTSRRVAEFAERLARVEADADVQRRRQRYEQSVRSWRVVVGSLLGAEHAASADADVCETILCGLAEALDRALAEAGADGQRT